MDKYLEYIKRVMAVAHTGITYSKDPYALENYHDLLDLSKNMLHDYSSAVIPRIDLFADQRYPTPQPTVRVVIVQDEKLLLVKEKLGPAAGKWSLPGGWVDIGQSILDAAISEGEEESGYPLHIVRPLAIMDRSKYIDSDIYDTFTLVFLAQIKGDYQGHNFEIEEVAWFELASIPELSFKLTHEELAIIMKAYRTQEMYVE
jgi:8-oxo-dGTP diphosphatase